MKAASSEFLPQPRECSMWRNKLSFEDNLEKTIDPDRFQKGLSGLIIFLFDKLELAYSISVRMVNTSGRLKISFFKNNG